MHDPNHTTDGDAYRASTDKQATDDLTTDGASDGPSRRSMLQAMVAVGSLGATNASGLAGETAAEPTASESGWTREEPQLYTPWTEEVGPDNAHPEYPRPQMVREEWGNLNGVWQFAGAEPDDSPPIGEELDERVLVPYPIESGLSGIKRYEPWMWYRREFEVPNKWLIPTAHPGKGVGNNPNSQRLLLHFERIDWEATVYVNGEEVTSHKGGYDHFVADVTDYLINEELQELVIGVYDPTGVHIEPYGTQPIGRQSVDESASSLFKTSTSGIWDTVWMEPVPEVSIGSLNMTPDSKEEVLRLTVETSTSDATVVATAYDGDEKVGRVIGPANEELELPVEDPHLWSPENPFLYDLDVKLRRKDGPGTDQETSGGKLLDSVESYFGMRSLGIQEVAGVARPTLNGEMVYHIGSLESGYWPDGIYTAPTDEALRHNLAVQKELGFNMVRKHCKVETRRWFYHTDQLGLLVWQDIPNMDEAPLFDPGNDPPLHDEEAREHFKTEVREIVTEHDAHPSMAVWTAFNEGWGIANTNIEYIEEVTNFIAELDPTRFINPMSGYHVGTNSDTGAGDVKDVHWYPGPIAPSPEPDRISVSGEYTTPSIQFPEHTFGNCGGNISPERFVNEYIDSIDQLRHLMVDSGISASVYTATTDLESVCNGHITYDRKVTKAAQAENGLEQVREAHKTIIEQSKLVMGNVVIDVEAPAAYDLITDSPTSFEISATVTNPETTTATDESVEGITMSLTSLSDDWSVAAETETKFGPVADSESVTATWEVTSDTPDGDVTVEVAVNYEIDGEQYHFDTERTVKPVQLAYWRFENSPEDSWGDDNSLSLHNGASYNNAVAVEGDYSLHLDGEDDYAQISESGSGILHDAFRERTVSMWIKPDTLNGDQVLFNEGGYYNGFALRIRDGFLEAIVKRYGISGTVQGPFDRMEWTHVAVVFDRGALRLYVDGTEVAANPDVGYDTILGHVAGSELGGNATTTPWMYDETVTPFFGGHIDATAIYNRALSPDEIESYLR